MSASTGLEPPHRLEIGVKLLWKFKETCHFGFFPWSVFYVLNIGKGWYKKIPEEKLSFFRKEKIFGSIHKNFEVFFTKMDNWECIWTNSWYMS